MKKNSILIVGLGVPSELTDVLLREGCDILRSETPLQAALVLLRGDAQAVLTVGDLGEEWFEFTDVALTMGKLVAVDSMVTVPAALATSRTGNGNGNGNVLWFIEQHDVHSSSSSTAERQQRQRQRSTATATDMKVFGYHHDDAPHWFVSSGGDGVDSATRVRTHWKRQSHLHEGGQQASQGAARRHFVHRSWKANTVRFKSKTGSTM